MGRQAHMLREEICNTCKLSLSKHNSWILTKTPKQTAHTQYKKMTKDINWHFIEETSEMTSDNVKKDSYL